MKERKKTQKILERTIGKSISELAEMDLDEELRFVREKTGKPLKFSKTIDLRMCGRGNPNIIRRRICTMEDIDQKISELK